MFIPVEYRYPLEGQFVFNTIWVYTSSKNLHTYVKITPTSPKFRAGSTLLITQVHDDSLVLKHLPNINIRLVLHFDMKKGRFFHNTLQLTKLIAIRGSHNKTPVSKNKTLRLLTDHNFQSKLEFNIEISTRTILFDIVEHGSRTQHQKKKRTTPHLLAMVHMLDTFINIDNRYNAFTHVTSPT